MKTIAPTPWKALSAKDGFDPCIIDANGKYVSLTGDEIRDHITSCVNACAGMDDPVMEVQRLKNKVTGAMTVAMMATPHASFMGSAYHSYTESTSKKGGVGEQKYHATLENTAGLGRDKETIKAVESLYTSSPETLQKAVDDARKIGIECAYDFSEVKNFCGLEKEPSWHELGIFPPVGIDCEINEPNMSYHGRSIHVFAHYNGRAFAWDEIEGAAYHSDDPSEFRPIQTEKQKIIKEIMDILPYSGFCYEVEKTAEKIYDKFLSAKKEQ